MFQRDELQKDIEMAMAAEKSADALQIAKRASGLRFLVDARQDQALVDVRQVDAVHRWRVVRTISALHNVRANSGEVGLGIGDSAILRHCLVWC